GPPFPPSAVPWRVAVPSRASTLSQFLEPLRYQSASGQVAGCAVGQDRETIRQRLRMAERHVHRGEENIGSQRRIVAEFARDGHDTTMARKLLATFEMIQAAHVEDRDRLRADLARC